MEQVRCTNCGSTAIIPVDSGEFCECKACGSTFSVPRGLAFSKVQLDHTQDIRAWREYLAKQLRLQQESSKARDYGGVKLFAQKILSVLPDDFCARYYVALADKYGGNDAAYVDFLKNASFTDITPNEIKEVVDSLVLTVEPKHIDNIKEFIARAYPNTYGNYDAALERNVRLYIQKLKYVKSTDRDVFICHRTAEPDRDIADAICTRLEERGLRCWIAPRNILAGSQNYERDILKGVENSRLFLLVSSFKSIYSEDCEMELKAAVLDGKALYSYRIDDTPYYGAFEKALSDVQWLDASDDPYAHLEQLVIDIKGILARDEREKVELEEKRLAAREIERLRAEEMRSAEKERIDRLEKIVARGVAATAPPTYTYRSRLKRAEIEIGSENYDRAQKIIDEVLDIDPESPLAWWLLLLCDYRVTSDEKLLEYGRDFTSNRNFKNAERFAELDAVFFRRLDGVLTAYEAATVKEMGEILKAAERQIDAENYEGASAMLAECSKYLPTDEDSRLVRRFPDVLSKYYWLTLWATYGQTPLVCVEDITRESAYENAVKYASPAQALEYERARETVSKNAQLFLRERSKNRANDGKLSDYLIDNKNILPVDVYNYYSSLLYFRKMLRNLNMTETVLRTSAIDISTNEYFMLAQSLATDEQKKEYDELLSVLENNRNAKRAKVQAQKDSEAKKVARAKMKLDARNRFLYTVLTISLGLGYVLFIVGAISIVAGHSSTAHECLIISTIARIVGDIAAYKIRKKFTAVVLSINIVAAVFTILIGVGFEISVLWISGHKSAPALIVLGAIAVIFEGILKDKYKKTKGDDNG